jgi:hypothetical protein
MWVKSLFRGWLGQGRTTRALKTRGRIVRLGVEALEDRTLPSSYTAASVSDLIADINAVNTTGGSNTIALVAGTTFALTAVNDTTHGATGLPQIAATDNLTILGNGATIARSTALGTPSFRLFDVASGASLSLSSLTLQGGLAFGSGVAAEGGAIYNQGILNLSGVTVQNNVAQGAEGGLNLPGQSAAGGGIYSAGVLTLQASSIQNNQAIGGQGGQGEGPPSRGGYPIAAPGGAGGSALGGGLYVGGGAASLTDTILAGNTAQGGLGGNGSVGGVVVGVDAMGGSGSVNIPGGKGGTGGAGLGAGLYAAGGTITLVNDSVTNSSAQGGAGGNGGAGKPKGANGSPGLGEGGGLYVDAAALAYLDAFTQANIKHNHASTGNADIYGSYSTYP